MNYKTNLITTEQAQALQAGVELDTLVVERVYQRAACVYRGALGESLYIVDETATRDSEHSTSANLIGGSWTRAYNADGQLVEFYGRPCSALSTSFPAAWEVVKYLENILDYEWSLVVSAGGYTFRIHNRVHYDGLVGKGETEALAICRCAVQI